MLHLLIHCIFNYVCNILNYIVNLHSYTLVNFLYPYCRVCKHWNALTRCPLLWKKVNVKFYSHHRLQKDVIANFSRILLSSVTHIKLELFYLRSIGFLNFEEFCAILATKCPLLKRLVLHNIYFTVSLQSVIHLCTLNMSNLEILSIHYFDFIDYSLKRKSDGHSKLKYLDIYNNQGNTYNLTLRFLNIYSLQRLTLDDAGVNGSWFQGDISFLDNLQVLLLRRAKIGTRTIQSLQNHALNLTELYLCHSTGLKDSDFRSSDSVFPKLVTVCLRYCHAVTHEGIINFIRSCQSLQNVYVGDEVAESYAQHPFIIANERKLQIVKPIDICMHYDDVNYLYEK